MPAAEVYRPDVVGSSVDRQLHVDNSTREIHVSNNNEKFRATELETGENHDGIVLTSMRGINQTLWMVVRTGAQISCVKPGFDTP